MGASLSPTEVAGTKINTMHIPDEIRKRIIDAHPANDTKPDKIEAMKHARIDMANGHQAPLTELVCEGFESGELEVLTDEFYDQLIER